MSIVGWLTVSICLVGGASPGAGQLVPAATPSPQKGLPWTKNKQRVASVDRKALVIGNTAYRKVVPLKNPKNDASDLALLLKSLGFQVELVQDADAPLVEKSIGAFADSLRPGDIALFFYAGHGMQIEAENYLVPVDFEPSNEIDAKYKCYRADRARELMEKSGAGVSIVILDACRNNPFEGKRMLVHGLAPMDMGLGTLVAYSAGPGQTADDNQSERNGLFTKYLLQQMREPTDIVTLFRTTRELVYKASGGRQRPWLHEDLIGTFYMKQPEPPALDVPMLRGPPVARNNRSGVGQELFNKGEYQAALADLEKAVRAEPHNPYAHNALGAAYSQLGLLKPAVDSFNQAISLKPDYAAAYYNRGLAYLLAGENSRYRLAVEDFTWAVEQEPSDPVLYNFRGKAYFKLFEFESALADYDRAIELNPGDPISYHGRGQVYNRRGEYNKAIRDFNEAIQRRPGFREAFQDRAQAYRALGDAGAAARDLQMAEQLSNSGKKR